MKLKEVEKEDSTSLQEWLGIKRGKENSLEKTKKPDATTIIVS